MKKSGEKRKRFEMEEMSEFRMVEEEEERCKYTDKEKHDVREWMCKHLYTRMSPNKKDTIRQRDLNSKYLFVPSINCLIASMIPTQLFSSCKMISFPMASTRMGSQSLS